MGIIMVSIWFIMEIYGAFHLTEGIPKLAGCFLETGKSQLDDDWGYKYFFRKPPKKMMKNSPRVFVKRSLFVYMVRFSAVRFRSSQRVRSCVSENGWYPPPSWSSGEKNDELIWGCPASLWLRKPLNIWPLGFVSWFQTPLEKHEKTWKFELEKHQEMMDFHSEVELPEGMCCFLSYFGSWIKTPEVDVTV